MSATFTVRVEGCPPFRGLTREEADALVRTARGFPSPDETKFGGPKIDVKREQRDAVEPATL